MQNLTNQPVFKGLAIAFMALLVAFFAAETISVFQSLRYIGSNPAQTDTITVNGTADVYATPDIATFSFSVSQQDTTVAAAQSTATTKANSIFAYLKKEGVSDADIQTSAYNIYPNYETQGGTIYGGGKQVIIGYTVEETVNVKVRNLADAGTIIGAIGGYGASNLSSLAFSVNDETALVHQARDKAIADARNQAESLASSLGVRLGRITSYSDGGDAPRPIFYAKDSMAMGSGAAIAPTPQLPTGQNEITSNVTITYEIK